MKKEGENQMDELIKPGTDNKPAGTYIEVGPNGEGLKEPRKIEIDQGDRLPPTSEEGNRWIKY